MSSFLLSPPLGIVFSLHACALPIYRLAVSRVLVVSSVPARHSRRRDVRLPVDSVLRLEGGRVAALAPSTRSPLSPYRVALETLVLLLSLLTL